MKRSHKQLLSSDEIRANGRWKRREARDGKRGTGTVAPSVTSYTVAGRSCSAMRCAAKWWCSGSSVVPLSCPLLSSCGAVDRTWAMHVDPSTRRAKRTRGHREGRGAAEEEGGGRGRAGGEREDNNTHSLRHRAHCLALTSSLWQPVVRQSRRAFHRCSSLAPAPLICEDEPPLLP